jgi:hypothetical protein
LPRELRYPLFLLFHPDRRRFFYLLQKLRHREGARQCARDMDVVLRYRQHGMPVTLSLDRFPQDMRVASDEDERELSSLDS